MEKRLSEAFDRITMPESCAQRIQEKLTECKPQHRRFTMVLNQRERKHSWKGGLAAACLLLLLVTVPLYFFRKGEEARVPGYTEPQPAEETLAEVIQEGLPFWEEGRTILDPLCLNMPEWRGYASLEDSFWTELVVRTLNGYAEDEKGNLQTQAGHVSLVGGRIRMDRETLSAYIEKIMGIPLPEFIPCGEYADLISYEGGAYYVANTVLSNFSFTLKEWTNGSFPQVTYSIHPAPGGKELGTVTFLLAEGEQEGSFIVLDKTVSARRVAQEDPAMEAAAMEYARAYFANDREKIVNHMTSRSNWDLVLSRLVTNMYTGSYPGGWNEPNYKIEDVTPYGFPWDTGAPVVYVTYSWNDEGYAGTYAVVLYMAKTSEGWKVRFSDEEPADSYDPDLYQIRSTAESFAFRYASGDAEYLKEYMAAGTLEPPVHECTNLEARVVDGGIRIGTDAAVDYDPDSPDPVTGELRAQVWVEFSGTDQDLNGDVLILNMVKKEDGWKVDAVSEG